jgi:ankyrin repeat protein
MFPDLVTEAIEIDDADKVSILLAKTDVYSREVENNHDELFILAAVKGSIKTLKLMAESPVFVEVLEEDYPSIEDFVVKTVLEQAYYVACKHGHIEVVKFLETVGPIQTACKSVSFAEAARKMHFGVVEYFLQNSFKIDEDVAGNLLDTGAKHGALWLVRQAMQFHLDLRVFGTYLLAASNGQLEILKYFDTEYVCPNANVQNSLKQARESAIDCAAKKGHLQILKYIHNLPHGMQKNYTLAFCAAAHKNQTDVMLYLMEKGADIHYNHDEPLIHCVRKNNLEMVKKILSTDVNRLNLNYRDINFVECSACNGNMEMLDLFVQKGCKIDFLNNTNVLYNTIVCGHLHMVKYILERFKIDVDKIILRLLDCAVRGNQVHVVEYLLSKISKPLSFDDNVQDLFNTIIVRNNVTIFIYFLRNNILFTGDRVKLLSRAVLFGSKRMAKFLVDEILDQTDLNKAYVTLKSKADTSCRNVYEKALKDLISTGLILDP